MEIWEINLGLKHTRDTDSGRSFFQTYNAKGEDASSSSLHQVFTILSTLIEITSIFNWAINLRSELGRASLQMEGALWRFKSLVCDPSLFFWEEKPLRWVRLTAPI